MINPIGESVNNIEKLLGEIFLKKALKRLMVKAIMAIVSSLISAVTIEILQSRIYIQDFYLCCHIR
jgi:flagellar biosynthesis protein FliQ